ncbi:hypothetical protein OESDEN_24897 [Oesophagostomum dentatum]|uniref:Uncharacterized protein n=1 Tax=Oesophagostomum dentatum TaxID=61180 RepID=A0A0B1RWD9_OESDE|nr:hypothetical protein OESDEN_24897 [Oesophagostomum dentatum]
MIDTFYDQKVRLVVGAEAPLDKLFLLTVDAAPDLSDSQRALMDDLDVQEQTDSAAASVFTGEEEAFAFDRTVSRLYEMQKSQYWCARKPSSF